VASGSGVIANLSGAFVSGSASVVTNSAVFSITNEPKADANIANQITSDGNKFISAYTASLSYTSDISGLSLLSTVILALGDGSPTNVMNGFGTVTLTFEVDSAYNDNKIRMYFLKNDGTVGLKAAQDVVNGEVEFTLTEYASTFFGGNIALAAVPSAAEIELAAN
jgi:hypothetical protein